MLKTPTMPSTDFFLLEATTRDVSYGEFGSRRPSAKPVNAAGCREYSRRSQHRFQLSDQEGQRNVHREMTDSGFFGEGGGYLDPVLSSLVSTQSVLDAVAPASVTARIRRRLQGMKNVPFLNCITGGMSCGTRTDNNTASKKLYCSSQHSAKTQTTTSTTTKAIASAHLPSLSRETSLRIRAFFTERSSSPKKVVLKDQLPKLKWNVFKSRSTSPTNSSDIRQGCETKRAVSPCHYSSAVRRMRRHETLVRMMERTLEETDENERQETDLTPRSEAQDSVKATKIEAQKEGGRHPIRSRKLRTQRAKSRKAATQHRRTATY